MSYRGGRWGRQPSSSGQAQQQSAHQYRSVGSDPDVRRGAGSRGAHHHGRHRGSGRSRHDHDRGRGSAAAQQAPPVTNCPPHVAQYLQQWHPMVDAELSAEQAIVNERLATWPLDRLKREGLVLLGLTPAKRGSLYGVPIWVLRQVDRGQMPFHRFVAGDEVLISTGHPLHGPGRALSGTVLERGLWELRLVSNDTLTTDGTPLRLDKGVNTVVYERMRAALNSLAKPPPLQMAAATAAAAAAPPPAAEGPEWPLLITHQLQQHAQGQQQQQQQQQQHRRGKRQRQQEEPDTSPPGTILADLLINPSAAAAAAAAAGPSGAMPASAVDWATGILRQQQGLASSSSSKDRQDLADRDAEIGLNKSQVAAIANCVMNKLSLIHGPPGTGKTTTTVALLALLVKRFKLPFPLLAVGQSHVAVDNLLEGLVDAGVNAVRIGQPVKVRDSLRGATLDALLEAHPKTREVETAAQQLREMRARLPTLQGRDRGLGHRDVSIMARSVTTMREDLVTEVLQGAQVICATCAAAGSDMLAGAKFPLVVLDEASQASEPEALIPLTRAAEHAVLVGDHMQLPPVINSDAAVAGGMAVSLFERLMRAGVPSAMLQVQYRMHPCLSAFPNTTFYGGRLVDGVSAEQRPVPAAFPWPNQHMPLVFLDVDGREEVASGGSKLNRAEATLVQHIISHLLTTSKEPRSSIGVITPYLAQLNLLTQQLASIATGPGIAATAAAVGGAAGSNSTSQAAGFSSRPAAAAAAAGQAGAVAATAAAYEAASAGVVDNGSAAVDVLEMKTVDGYQGREKEIIVFSAVRANPQGQVGFLEDWRRLNVAITRPRRGLILVGNATTLMAGDEKWRSYLQWLRQKACVVTAQQIQQQMAGIAEACRR